MKTRDLPKHGDRQDRLIQEHTHDPYKTRLKLPEPTVCPQCDAVYHKGRWDWATAPAGANKAQCQACHRIADDCPAGVVTLSGGFLKDHRAEIMGLARNEEEQEKGQHPLHRIMKIEDQADRRAVVITTTDIHLPRRIGEALQRAYEGELDYHYEAESYFIRVDWQREA